MQDVVRKHERHNNNLPMCTHAKMVKMHMYSMCSILTCFKLFQSIKGLFPYPYIIVLHQLPGGGGSFVLYCQQTLKEDFDSEVNGQVCTVWDFGYLNLGQ